LYRLRIPKSRKLFIMKRAILPVLGAALLWASQAAAENWGHWRGPDGNGVSTTAEPPIEWSDSKNVRWKVAVPGLGSGSPVVWENRVFVTTAIDLEADAEETAGEDRERPRRGRFGRRGFGRGGFGRGGEAQHKHRFEVHCYDRDSGDLVWKRVAIEAVPHEGTHSTNGFASASPCTDGEHVYASFGSRGIYCYTMDGELVWSRRDLGEMETRNGFGEGSSPTLADNKLIVPWDHEGPSFLFALEKKTGETIWKAARDEPTCWATPLVVEHRGSQQIVMNGQNAARAYDLETGKELWRCGGQTQRPAASAVQRGNRVFVGSGFRGSFMGAFQLGGQGDLAGTDSVVWTLERDTPDIPSPVLSENRLYFFKGKSGILSCFNADTGEPFFVTERIRDLGRIYASPVAAGGHVYLTDRSGTTVVIKDSTSLEVVAVNSVGETVDATPAPVDNQLFIRGQRHLFCIDAS
jgi:outer membrane protein assembly factor BamB